MSQYLIDQIASKANIEVLPFAQVVSADGENHLERIEVRVQGKRLVRLSITHKLSTEDKSQLDICEARATMNDSCWREPNVSKD